MLVTHFSFLQILIFWHFPKLQGPSQIFSTNTKQSDSNGIRTHSHLVPERTLNYLGSLAKWLSVQLRTKWLWAWLPLLSVKLQIWHLVRARSFLTFRQTIECGFTLKLIRDMIITCRQSKIVTEKFQIKEFSGTSISHVFSFIRTSFHDFQKLDNSLYDDNNFCFSILKLDVLSISFSVWVRNSFQRRNNSYTDNNIIDHGTLVLVMKI